MGPRQGISGPTSGSRSLPLGLPDAAHRKRDISDAAHGVAVVSGIDRTGEDLMQMHVRDPGWPGECTRGSMSLAPGPPPAAKALPPTTISGPTARWLRLIASSLFFLPPSSSLPCELLNRRRRRCRPDRRSAAEMPGCSHCRQHPRTNAGGGQGCVRGGGAPGRTREPGACRKGRSARGRWAVRAPTRLGATAEWEGKPLLPPLSC